VQSALRKSGRARQCGSRSSGAWHKFATHFSGAGRPCKEDSATGHLLALDQVHDDTSRLATKSVATYFTKEASTGGRGNG
jgi:hypothetical protein